MPIFNIDKLLQYVIILIGSIMKKRVIALMVVGVVSTATIIALSKPSIGGGFEESPTDEYIVIEHNDKDVLHYGSYQKDEYGTSNRLILKCGQKLSLNTKHSVYQDKPYDDIFDEQCEGCFSNE